MCVGLTRRQVIDTIVGTGYGGVGCNSGPGTAAVLNGASSIAVTAAGDVFIADTASSCIVAWSARTRLVTSLVGPSDATVSVTAVAVDGAGNVFFSWAPESGGGYVSVYHVSTGIVTVIAGTDSAGYTGDGGPGTSAELNGPPLSIAVNAAGTLVYIADTYNIRIRAIAGVITPSRTPSSTASSSTTPVSISSTPSPTASPSGTRTGTTSPSDSRSVSKSASVTSTRASLTHTPSHTRTDTHTPTRTMTGTRSQTPSRSNARTPTPTPTWQSPTQSTSPAATVTPTNSPSRTQTRPPTHSKKAKRRVLL